MALMIGFRGESVGTDTVQYQKMYELLGSNGYGGYPEPVYGILCVWGYSCGISFQIFQSVLTFLALCCTAYVIRKQSPNYCLSLFLLLSLYFFFYTMNIYRELIACYISVLAVYILFSENIRWSRTKYVLLIILAAGFHKSALILLLLLFIRKVNLGLFIIIGGVIVSFVIGIADMANIFAPFLGKYEKYLDRYNRTGDKLIQGVFLSIYWLSAFYYFYNNSSRQFRASLYMKMLICGIVVSNLFIRQDMGLRLVLYFTIPLIVGIPKFIKENRNGLLNQTVVIFYSSIYFFVFLLLNSADVVPYTTD